TIYAKSCNQVGGIVGNSSGTITNCYNLGDVTGYSGVGGIATEKATITNCYNLGSVTIGSRGGGIMSGGSGSYPRVINCINMGKMTGGYAILGKDYNAYFGTATNCYYGGNCTSTADGSSANSSIKIENINTDAYAKNEAWYTDSANWNATYPWDFDNVWEINKDYNDGFPVFKWQVIRNWTQLSDTSWEDETDGTTEATAYIIDTPEKLAGLAAQVNAGQSYAGKYFKQTANIDLGGYEWIPIGFSYESADYVVDNKNFEGSYDGQNYVISGLSLEAPNAYNGTGLFASIYNATIKNINIQNAAVGSTRSSASYVGTIAANAYGSSVIENCHVSNTSVYGNYNVGGVVGRCWTGPTIKNCSFDGYVSGNSQQVAGIAGYFRGALIENCYNTGIIKAQAVVGGIAGYVDGSLGRATINNCISDGSIEGDTHIGALVGWLVYGSTIKNSAGYGFIRYYSELEDMGSGPFAGGIIGHVLANYDGVTMNIIENCSFVGGCNRQIDPFFASDSTGYSSSSLYAYINGKGYYSSGDFSGWALCGDMNDGLPLQESLYAVAQFGDSVDASWFANKGFEKA
ncbi:MAG: hypothetical protein NC218_12705, partial [Acetobacter sp.]|nr:hypothetical protein [Acetobacter sp.]